MLFFLQVVSQARMSDDIHILALANFCLAIQLGRMATESQVNRKFTLIFYYFHWSVSQCIMSVVLAVREHWKGTNENHSLFDWHEDCPSCSCLDQNSDCTTIFIEADAQHQQLTKWKLCLQDPPAVISFKEKATSSKMADQNHDFIMTGSFKSFTVLLQFQRGWQLVKI